jgi:16S rRNA (guanine527-N7)-methyltransferase
LTSDARAEAAEAIRAGLSQLGRPLEAEDLSKLLALAELVAGWGARLNLTGHRGILEVARDLVLDAAALEAALPPARSIADVGSGAGFPGLPIAILRRDAHLTLIESRERRHHFQRFAIRELNLDNASAVHGRAESLPVSAHGLAVAQATARPEEAVDLLTRWTEPGGWLAIPGGASAPRIRPRSSIVEVTSRAYRAPLTGKPRTLWLGRFQSDASPGCR